MGDLDDWDSFERIYRESYRPVLRFLARRMSLADAEDVTAEVFTIAWRRWSTREGEPLPWLYGIARKAAANALRTSDRADQLARRLVASSDQTREGGHESAEDTVLSRAAAVSALGSLSASDREALLLVSWDGLAQSDAARVMGRNKAAFAVQLHRARIRLERALAREATSPQKQKPTPTATVRGISQ
ncbi:RNA polymerase sigma factor [Streptomyces purpurascens]|uniref:RNA polymerase sigma factor n=1 Tax=Streptomyces purpurascens TaxID=1924 RepID=UPI0033C97132